MIIGIGILMSFIMGFLGRYVAKEKNRSKAEGFWLGFLFSILGVIIVALLPTKEKPKEVLISDKEKERIKREEEQWKKNKRYDDENFGRALLQGAAVLVFIAFAVMYIYGYFD